MNGEPVAPPACCTKHDPLYVVNTLINSARNGVIDPSERCCEVKVLTSSPSCLPGLKRSNDDAAGRDADYIVVEVAKNLLGPDWMSEYVRRANTGGIERVLV